MNTPPVRTLSEPLVVVATGEITKGVTVPTGGRVFPGPIHGSSGVGCAEPLPPTILYGDGPTAVADKETVFALSGVEKVTGGLAPGVRKVCCVVSVL